jgi:SAM-dependent methyltransferase
VSTRAADLVLRGGSRLAARLRSWRDAHGDPRNYTTLATREVVPVQREAYYLALRDYVRDGDDVLDVGFGIGYGVDILSIGAATVSAADVDAAAVVSGEHTLLGRNPKVRAVVHYDGVRLPFGDGQFDVVTSVDVIEHVPDYHSFIDELLRVSRRSVVISTPNRRPEYTRPDGRPKNYWHLREWSSGEFGGIVRAHDASATLHHINGAWEGPFTISPAEQYDTLALTASLSSG